MWLGRGLVAKLCLTHCDPTDCGLQGPSVHGISMDKNTRVSCHLLLQGIFLTQGSNLGLLALQLDSLPTEPLGSLGHENLYAI